MSQKPSCVCGLKVFAKFQLGLIKKGAVLAYPPKVLQL